MVRSFTALTRSAFAASFLFGSSLMAGAAALGTAIVVGSPGTAHADFRVAFVDMQRALQGSDPGKEAQKAYESEVKRSQSKIDEKKSDYERLQKAYGKQKDSLSDKARQEKEEELLNLEKELKRNFQDSQDSLRRRNAQIVGELVERLRKVVEEIGEEEGYTLILEKGSQALLYANTKIEITDDVIKRFNEKRK